MKFENNIYEHTEMAQKFIELGNKFIEYDNNNNSVLEFCATGVYKNECGTVACHGGFGLVILGGNLKKGFGAGAKMIAEYLGFLIEDNYSDISESFEWWAHDNPHLWDNKNGLRMFSHNGEIAFGFAEDTKITLSDVGKHYLKVGNNILSLKDV